MPGIRDYRPDDFNWRKKRGRLMVAPTAHTSTLQARVRGVRGVQHAAAGGDDEEGPVRCLPREGRFEAMTEGKMSIRTATPTTTTYEKFRKLGDSLPLTVEAFDRFNLEIQREIERQIICGEDLLAVELAQLKLDINKRIYNHRRSR